MHKRKSETKTSNLARGFTFVELLLTVAIITVIAISATPFYARFFTQNNVQNTYDQLKSTMRKAQSYAINSRQNNSWGIHYAANQFTLFSGSSFAGRNTAFDENYSVNPNVTVYNMPDLVFSRLTGTPSATPTILIRGDNNTRAITVNSQGIITGASGGMIVYGDGGNTTQDMKYRILDGTTGQWSQAQPTLNVNGNPAYGQPPGLLSLRLYASPTRNEKILVSKHLDSSGAGTEYIYAQVWNGNTSTWGNLIQAAVLPTASAQETYNFDVAYLKNGDAMLIVSDNTSIPKSIIWNGTNWIGTGGTVWTDPSKSILLQSMVGIPKSIEIATRPKTNEVMAVFLLWNGTSSMGAYTQYFNFNSGVYQTTDWSSPFQLSSITNARDQQDVDFTWNIYNPTLGAVVYGDASTDADLDGRIWTADGSGGGSWSSQVSAPIQTTAIGPVNISSSPNTPGFISCVKDLQATGNLYCYNLDSTSLTWSNQTLITANSPTDIGRSFGIDYDYFFPNDAIVVYADTTSPAYDKSALIKKYNTISGWDTSPTVATTSLPGNLDTARAIPLKNSSDIMLVYDDSSNGISTLVWNGTTKSVYSDGSGRSFTIHGTNARHNGYQVYDFVWDYNY